MANPPTTSSPTVDTHKHSPGRSVTVLTIILLIALASAPYIQTLSPSWELLNWDDEDYINNNPLIQRLSWHNLKSIFTEYYFTDFMPLNLLSLAADYATWGHDADGEGQAWRFHLTNLVLHALNTVLAFFLLRQILRRPSLALIGAAFFALHPVQPETVAWASERKSLLSGAMVLGSLILYVGYEHRRGERLAWGWYVPPAALAVLGAAAYFLSLLVGKITGEKPALMPDAARWLFGLTCAYAVVLCVIMATTRRGGGWYAGALLLATAGPFAKPVTLVLFPILYLYMFCYEDRRTWGRSAIDKLPIAAVCLMGLVIGHSAQRFAGTVLPWHGGNIITNAITMMPVLPRYVDHFVFPLHLTAVYHPPVFVPTGGGTTLLAALLGALALLALAGLLVLAWFKWRRGVFWLGWAPICLTPVSNFLAPMNTLIADRYLYLPAVALGAVLALALAPALDGRFALLPRRVGRGVAIGATAALLLLLLLMSIGGAGVWRDPYTLWTHTLTLEPRGAIIRNNLGWVYYDRAVRDDTRIDNAMLGKARALLERSVAMERNLSYSQKGLGMVYLKLGLYHQAIEHLERAVALDQRESAACFFLAQAYGHLKQFDKNQLALEEAVRRNPGYFEALHNLGTIYDGRGNYEKAAEYYQRAIAANPNADLSYFTLGMSLHRLGRTAEALQAMRGYLRVAPPDGRFVRAAQQFIEQYGGH